MSDNATSQYLDPKDSQELLSSKIDQTLIKLNIKSISGDAVGDALFISPDIKRTNPGMIEKGLLMAYSNVLEGGWLFEGLSLKTLDTSDFCCFKPCKPRKNRDGKIIKYENPPQMPLGIYVPKVSNKVAFEIFEKHSDIAIAPVEDIEALLDNPNQECTVFWGWVLKNPLPVVNTEGVKKTLALLSNGHIAFGLSGVTGWNEPKTLEIRDCIKPLLVVPRKITFAWDADKNPRTVAMVDVQKLKFSLALTKSGCTTYNAKWSPSLGKGLDDVENWDVIEGAIAGAKPSPIFTEDTEALAAIWQRIVALPQGIPRNKRITEFLAVLNDIETRDFYRAKAKELGLTNKFVDMAVAKLLGQDRDSEPLPQDIGLQLTDQWSKKLAYSEVHQSWLCYELKDKGVFSLVSEGVVTSDIQTACLGLDINPDNHFRDNVLGTVKAQTRVTFWAEPDPIDNIPFQDGIYNLKTGELLEHSPDNKLLWTLPRNYVADSQGYPVIDKWLDELTGGKKLERAILEAFLAAMLRGMSNLQRFLLLTGKGGNGKGLFLNFASLLIGEKNVWTGTIRDLEKDHRVAELQCKRLAKFDDEETYYGNWQTFKNLTGDSELVGALKFKDSVQFKPTAITMVAANGTIAGGVTGRWYKRRVVHIHTDFKPQVENHNLISDLEKELPAYTQFLLSISAEQIKNTIYGHNIESGDSSDKVSSTFLIDRIKADSLVAWINERLIVEPGCLTQLSLSERYEQKDRDKALFNDYVQFLKDGQYKGISNAQTFRDNLVTNLEMLKIPFRVGKDVRNRIGSMIGDIRVRTEGDFEFHPTFLDKLLEAEQVRDTPVTLERDTCDTSVTPPVTPLEPLLRKAGVTCDTSNRNNHVKEKSILSEGTGDTLPPWEKKTNIIFPYIDSSDDQVSQVSHPITSKGLDGVTQGVTEVSHKVSQVSSPPAKLPSITIHPPQWKKGQRVTYDHPDFVKPADCTIKEISPEGLVSYLERISNKSEIRVLREHQKFLKESLEPALTA